MPLASVARSIAGKSKLPTGSTGGKLRFAAAAARYECEISVGRDGEWVDGRSVLSLLSLAAGTGTVLRIRATGPDARQAVEALGALLEEPLEAN